MTLRLNTYETPEAAAKALYEHLRTKAAEAGQKPDCEVALSPPGEGWVNTDEWHVVWEAGPYEWGVDFSLGDGSKIDATGGTGNRNWYTEPYWGFDVAFVDERTG
jgi:hypothetical protein